MTEQVYVYFSGTILPARDYPPHPARKINPESQAINPLLTKLLPSRRLDIGHVLFFLRETMNIDSFSVHKQEKKKEKNLTNIQPS